MIQFNEAPEKKDIAEFLSSPAIKCIIPERLSPDEARNFWDDVFTERGNEVSEISEEDICREIFGRDEDEFQIDFDISEELQHILDLLDPSVWGDFSDEEKIGIIDQFVQALANDLDIINVPDVVFFDGPTTSLGAFSPSDNCVKINATLLDRPDILRNVIPHELRHAYQHQRADAQETWMDILYYINFEHYISPVWLSDNTCLYYTDYYDQLVEAEARAFAMLFS